MTADRDKRLEELAAETRNRFMASRYAHADFFRYRTPGADQHDVELVEQFHSALAALLAAAKDVTK